MKKIISLISIVSCLLFNSCLNVEDIQIVSVDRFKIESLTKLDVGVKVRNESRHKIKIQSAELELYNESNSVLSLIVNRTITVPRRSVEVIDIPIHIKLRNPIMSMVIVSNLKKYKSSLTISGDVRVKIGLVNKKINFKNMPISQFIDTFGANLSSI